MSIIKPIPGWAVWRGDRLFVPSTWHERHIGMLGGADANARLLEWYISEDAHLMKTQTPVRDWFKWLDARYAKWVPDTPEEAPTNDAFERADAAAQRRIREDEERRKRVLS